MPALAAQPSARASPPGTGARPTSGPGAHPVLVVVVVVVSLLLVGTAVGVFVLQPGTIRVPPPQSIPLGTMLGVGAGVEAACQSPSTFATNGCAVGHAGYNLWVASGTVTVGDVAFEVLTAAGKVAHETEGLGFTIFNVSGVVLAQFAVSGGLMTMGSETWTYSPGTTPSTPFGYSDYIVIDMGTDQPTKQGLLFVVIGVGQYTGTVSTTLP